MTLYLIIVALSIINLTGFVLAALDKWKARKKLWRIPEKAFFLLSIMGGCIGIYISLLLFRHKTKHWTFMAGIPVIFILQLLLIYYITIHWKPL